MESKKNILFISHDGNRAGAQIFLLNIMRYFKSKKYGVVLLILNNWGTLREDFETNFDTYYLDSENQGSKIKKIKELLGAKNNLLKEINKKYIIDLIYANTIASVGILEEVNTIFKKPIISHIHELIFSIEQFGSIGCLEILKSYSTKIIACSKAVKENLISKSIDFELKTTVVHSFVENEKILDIHRKENVIKVKKEFGIDENCFLIGACGNADWRKAPDVFLNIVKKVASQTKNVKFIWVGVNKNDILFFQLSYDAKKLGIEKYIIWLPPTPKAISIINALDIFLVCSREDPFPLVMLEAALCEKPIIGFKNTGGAEEFIEDDCGFTSSYLDIQSISQNIINLQKDPLMIVKMGKLAQIKVLKNYSFENSIIKIEEIIQSF